ncbi:MAG: undecaprenyl/decaprenyl-phosphate alpha-N-acetylglucosaminyl 1-phosphate transferase [Desulfobacteraceae bacterium]|nr:undecaprenyl/decaprenyl-phosphate alpha-N-acetylglucosaminyl 1-phosphate transferase [Desulfobacteraceae bacterium]
MYLFTVFIVALLLTIALIPVVKSMAFKMNIVDVPNSRKVHVLPMPKSGGISIAIGALVPVLLWVPRTSFLSAVLLGSGIIVAGGVIDDIKELGYKAKLAAQVAAALVVIFYGKVTIGFLGNLAPTDFVLTGFFSVALTLFVIVGVTNAINLADGLDGLAGGISMLSFVAIGFLAYRSGNTVIAIMSVAVIGAIFGFLRFNTHPAVIFMGDAGSQLLGFLSVTFALVLTQANTPYSRLIPLLLIGFPILDTLTVMLERIAKGRSPFVADKNHFHHRLMSLGLYHSEAVLVIYILQAIFIAFAFVFRFYSEWVHLLFFLAFAGLIIGGFALAALKGWEFRRGEVFDTLVKGRLRVLKEKKIFIKISFNSLKIGLPLLFFFQVLIPRHIPGYIPAVAGTLMVMIIGVRFFKRAYRVMVLRLALYLTIPVVLYFGETESADWIRLAWVDLLDLNRAGFLVILFAGVITINLTRRRNGFKITPMDILVFIVVLVFPHLPSAQCQSIEAGMTVAKALALFFSYDILIGELRGEITFVELSTMATLLTVVITGIL